MENILELIKGGVRPILIVWGWVVFGCCVMAEVEVPLLFSGPLTAITLEYIGERVKKRLKEK